MKLYAQLGYQEGEKAREALTAGYIDGAIFSPRDMSRERLQRCLFEFRPAFPNANLLFDPQYYACFVAGNNESRLGKLVDDYGPHYFAARRRSHLESEARVRKELERTLRFEETLPVTAWIAPNIVVSGSCNSVEAVIAKHFIRHTQSVAAAIGAHVPVYATLALSRDALLQKDELVEFLEDITTLDEPPDGFYLLISVNQPGSRAELSHADVIARAMLVNYTLTLNGYAVINGYSDILTPFLGVAGGAAGATGWFSNLRAFGLNRFGPDPSFGRQPLVRYLSCRLLNRITAQELALIRALVPEVANNLPTDAFYPEDGEPGRHEEALQTWDAIQRLNAEIVSGDVAEGLRRLTRAIDQAQEAYDRIGQRVVARLDSKSDPRHLESMREAVGLFRRLAELREGE